MSGTTPAVADKPLDDDDILLTDAERAAMEEDDQEGEEQGGDEQQDGGEAEPEASAAAPEAKAEPPSPEAAAPAGDAATAPITVPLIRGGDTAAAEARLAEIDTESDALATRFDDGDLTAKEYAAALKKLQDERSNLDWTIRKADLAAEMAEQQATQAWFSTVNEFLAEHSEIDPKNKLLFASFDMAVREVTGDEANAALTGRQKLQKAYDRWAADLNIKPAAKADTKPEAPKAPPRKPLPPSLNGIPAAEVSGTDDGKYAALDRLMTADPLAYEERLAAMSDADREAYLQVT